MVQILVELTCFSRDMASQPMRRWCIWAALFIAMETIRQNWDAAATPYGSCVPRLPSPMRTFFFYSAFVSHVTVHLHVHYSESLTTLFWAMPEKHTSLHILVPHRYVIPPSPSLRVETNSRIHTQPAVCIPGARLSLRIIFVYHHTMSLGPRGLRLCVCLQSPPNGLLSTSPANAM